MREALGAVPALLKKGKILWDKLRFAFPPFTGLPGAVFVKTCPPACSAPGRRGRPSARISLFSLLLAFFVSTGAVVLWTSIPPDAVV